jgi:putative oxidoreductase
MDITLKSRKYFPSKVIGGMPSPTSKDLLMASTSTQNGLGTSRLSVASTSRQHTATPHAYDIGLLVLRLGLGFTIASHGAQKLFGWFGGGGIKGTGAFFSMAGFPHGQLFAVIAGLCEGVGGLALALGLLTPLAGAAVFGAMVNAIAVDWSGGFLSSKGVGWEYPFVIAVGAVALAFTGPGRYALDRLLPVVRNHRAAFGAATVALGVLLSLIVLLVKK